MSDFTAETTIADIVTKRPSTAALFDQLGIDFCCNGERPLAEAASEHGLDPQTLLATFNALDAVQGDTAGAHDVQSMSSADLIDHIIEEHHARTRKSLPMITELLETIVRVHGEQDANLAVMLEKFNGLAEHFTEHMQIEEEQLFPVCRDAEAGKGGPADPALIEQLTHQHAEVGETLTELRELAGGYDLDNAYCNTHRFTMQSLSEFEEDVHVHVHEENNVLFPRARTALEAASAK